MVMASIFMSPSERPLYVPIDDNVELWAKLRGTIGVARRYPTVVRSTLQSQEYVGHDGAIDSVRDGEDA
ncbi:hypothetical protein GOBAR_AA04718 [Gossypium barbadense]|uniref:Uncharacterized protein n=1 Tax=Gossypium barbadense TaxID=3634 RepID=A0A2P5YJW9_GOSBA|nr:hypothetical protein GOBAR_AA04718 [Gossypium barbadense]